MSKKPIGGGPKKVLYTLETVRRIGPLKATKALAAKNTCKACALGMGGQQGGMTNELGEFPSVCNKSVQAQSTDIQPEIPSEIFAHTLDELRELTPRELETLGRLNMPIHKPSGEDRYHPISWEDAISLAAARLSEHSPERAFFYSSGRSSNEAGFLFQLLARAYGTNNVTNCSYYCHQATGVGLGSAIGTGTATVELADLGISDLIFVIGANPSSNHPRFIHQLKNCRDRGGDVVVINPAKEPGLVKFAIPKSPKSMLAGGSEIASAYLQPRIGEDMALLKGIAKAVLENGAENRTFIGAYTEGFESFQRDIEHLGWSEIDARTGISQTEIKRIAALYTKAQSAVFAWGMGITHHVHGTDTVETIAALALLRGMIARPGAGLLPLRGHSNVQGVGTIGVKPVLPEDVIARMERYYDIALPIAEGLDTMASMQAAADGEIDAAVFMGGNFYAANPNAAWAERTLDKIGFKLSLTTTLNQSHVIGVESGESLVLPVTARDEEWEPTTQESMFNYVRMSDGGITRLSNARPETVVLSDLAMKLLPDSPIDFSVFKRHRRIREAIAEIVPGMEALADIDVAKQEFHISGRLIHQPVFKTPGGKAYFRTRALPEKSQKTKNSFTLSTIRSEGQFNSIIYEERDTYRGTQTRWCVFMNADDMHALGVDEKDVVTLESAHGEMRDVRVKTYDIPPGDVMAYYPEANALTGTQVDPRSKTPSFKSTAVTIKSAP